MAKVVMLTKRRDACWFIRVLTPIPHVAALGHEIREEEFEKVFGCVSCRKGGSQEFQLLSDHPDDKMRCRECGHVFMENVSTWKDSVLDSIDWADAVGFQRAVNPEHIELMKLAKSKGKFVFTIDDDDYFNVPEWNTGYEYYTKRRHLIEETFKIADGVTVTTPAMKDLYGSINKNVQLIPNANDIELIDVTAAANAIPTFAIRSNGNQRQAVPINFSDFNRARQGKKFFAWGGSPTHEKDLEMVIKGLRRLMEDDKDVIVGFMAYCHRSAIQHLPSDRLFLFGLVPIVHYFSAIKCLNQDYLFAPVVANQFNKCKSANKSHEACAIGAVPICSNFDTYRHAFSKGFYATQRFDKNQTDYEWRKAFKYAAAMSESERNDFKIANKEFVNKYYDIKVTAPIWSKFFDTGKAEPTIYEDLMRNGEQV